MLAGIVASHTALFTLMLGGVVPDLGNWPAIKPHLSVSTSIILHVLLQGVYVAAFVAGRAVDRRYRALLEEAEQAHLQAARVEAQLADARAELDAALAGESRGIFSGLRVGAHQLGRLLGRGGMGEVYEALTVPEGARVALKLVRGDRVADPRSLRLLFAEAEALGRVRSAHVARVLAVGGVDEELPHIAMEYIEGRTLGEILRERPRLAPDEVAAIVRDIGRGLADVHDAGVLHLDLKPHNLIRAAADGRWMLVDFGVARLMAGAQDGRLVMGTPAYMAPEQAAGEAVDARTDLYSLCTIVYRTLAGRPPLLGDHPAVIARAARLSAPPDPRAYAPVPEDVAAALRVGLAERPADRFASARELGAAFEGAFGGALAAPVRRRAARLPPWGA